MNLLPMKLLSYYYYFIVLIYLVLVSIKWSNVRNIVMKKDISFLMLLLKSVNRMLLGKIN